MWVPHWQRRLQDQGDQRGNRTLPSRWCPTPGRVRPAPGEAQNRAPCQDELTVGKSRPNTEGWARGSPGVCVEPLTGERGCRAPTRGLCTPTRSRPGRPAWDAAPRLPVVWLQAVEAALSAPRQVPPGTTGLSQPSRLGTCRLYVPGPLFRESLNPSLSRRRAATPSWFRQGKTGRV